MLNALAAAYALCGEQVRRDDHDRWLASLYWPAQARPHAHALLAFALEIARVRQQVSEPMLGEVRYQWWRDAITDAAPAGNPLAEALLDTVARFNLDTTALLAMIEARSFDLYDDPMPSMQALDNYVRDTSVTLFEAVARVLAPGRLPPPCVGEAGRAYAMTALLRALPFQVMKGQLFLPLDVLETFGVRSDHVLAHLNSPLLRMVLNDMRARVRPHIAAMHEGLPTAGPAGAACLPAFLCAPYLRQMEAPGLNPFETPIELPPWRKQWVLWRAARSL